MTDRIFKCTYWEEDTYDPHYTKCESCKREFSNGDYAFWADVATGSWGGRNKPVRRTMYICEECAVKLFGKDKVRLWILYGKE